MQAAQSRPKLTYPAACAYLWCDLATQCLPVVLNTASARQAEGTARKEQIEDCIFLQLLFIIPRLWSA